MLDGFKPQYESTVTANLWRDGAVMLGKLNMDEFAMGSSNETSYYGNVINPWKRKGSNAALVPGGSSGGSAAAVAAHICAAATATDTGGSIRQPAAFTGTVGIKPTYGRCSRWGIVAFASSLDQAGPIARDVRDAAIMLKSMASVDPKDTTSVDLPVPDYEAAIGRPIKGLRVGIPKEYRVEGAPAEIDALWEQGAKWLKEQGAEIVEISLPHTKYALPAYYIVAPAEASSNLARYDGVRYGLRVPGDDIVDMYENSRAAGFGPEVKRRILIGTYVLSAGYYDAYYVRAQKVRTLIKRDFDEAWNKVDVVLTPATPSPAFAPGEITDPVQMYLNDIFTVTVNMAGLPGFRCPPDFRRMDCPSGFSLSASPSARRRCFRPRRPSSRRRAGIRPASGGESGRETHRRATVAAIDWIIQQNIIGTGDHDNLIKSITHVGDRFHELRLVPFVHEAAGPIPAIQGPCIVYGSSGLLDFARRQGWSPAGWDGPGFDATILIERLGRLALNAEARECSLREAVRIAHENGWGRIFIRPVSETKAFAGQVLALSELESWTASWLLDAEMAAASLRVIVAPARRLGREWRFFVVAGQIVSVSQYAYAGRCNIMAGAPDNVIKFASDILKLYQPSPAFVQDVAEVLDGEAGLHIVELNSVNSSGFYNCNVPAIVAALSDLVRSGSA